MLRWCDQCQTEHEFTCPKTSEKRRQQNREAQRRWRAKQKEKRAAEQDERTIAALKKKITELQGEVAYWKAKDKYTNRSKGADIIKVAGGWKPMVNLTHPDRHNGSAIATKVTAYIIDHFKK